MESARDRAGRKGTLRLTCILLSAALLAGCLSDTDGDGGGPTEDVAVPGDPALGVATARCIGLR